MINKQVIFFPLPKSKKYRFGVYKNIKRRFIDIVPIMAYIRELFFKYQRSRSSFISSSNFKVNILGKDVLDLYGLVFKVEFNLI